MTEKNNIRVTIGLPVYNGEQYLAEAVQSLLDQTYKDFYLIISDNFSTDSTQDLCKKFSEEDPRIIYHQHERNLGAAANFNHVVHSTRTEYFAWANHDDLWADTYLEQCVALLDNEKDAVLAYSAAAKIDEQGNRVARLTSGMDLNQTLPHQRLRHFHNLFRRIDKEKSWHTHEIEGLWIPVYGLIRTDALRQTGLIGSYISSDTILLEELLMHGRFVEAEDCLFFKRDHAERSMRAKISYDDRIEWFTGKAGSKFIIPRWRLFWERLRATSRTKLGIREKLLCYFEMLFFYARRPHEGKALVKEVLINLQRVLYSLGLRMNLPKKW